MPSLAIAHINNYKVYLFTKVKLAKKTGQYTKYSYNLTFSEKSLKLMYIQLSDTV